ncbi:hypothetical protein G7046_g5581 [Stylonectria norvegica]|nr:hypothetical protein G7046_g5581 [Stylonectria norvegica]
MPCFRGIDVSIVTQSASGKLPEFPHPDASSVRILAPSGCPPSPQQTSSDCSDSESIRLQKTNPRISVYIPSVPGAQFWVQYSLNRLPEPPCHLYFKLLMNGRSITSWGINPALQTSGTVTRALYEPCDRWHYKEDGIVLKREGIESRHFYFLPAAVGASVAEDGGLIEVQAFRARGRKRRAPVLLQHRSQESSPSGGLVDYPEDACYYDWLLTDPTDSPFASFRFHYRSWLNLRQLSLVPPLKDSDSAPDRSCQRSSESACDSPKRLEGGGGVSFKQLASLRRELAAELTLMKLPFTFDPQSLSSLARHSSGSPQAKRPLPEIPEVGRAPRKSFESSAPSIAPSLLPYIEEDMAEDVEFGMATQIPLRSNSLPTLGENIALPLHQATGPSQRPNNRSLGPGPQMSKSWPLAEIALFEDQPATKSAKDHAFERHSSPADGVLGETLRSLFDAESVLASTSLLPEDSLLLSEGEWMKGCGSSDAHTGTGDATQGHDVDGR